MFKFSLQIKTRKGWCPRTGGGQRLMNRKAVNEDIVLATCQDKFGFKIKCVQNISFQQAKPNASVKANR